MWILISLFWSFAVLRSALWVCGQLTSPPQLPAANLCAELRSRSAHPSSEVDSNAAISVSLIKTPEVRGLAGGGMPGAVLCINSHNEPDVLRGEEGCHGFNTRVSSV